MAKSKAKPEADPDAPVPPPDPTALGCVLKALPADLALAAAGRAIGLSPANRPLVQRLYGTGPPPAPLRIAALTTKYWGPQRRILSVSFLEPTAPALRRKVLAHMNEWAKSGCVSFAQTDGPGRIRISRGYGGYWSYLGTDCLMIPPGQPTMNLQGFTLATPDSEWMRVVPHEAGHTLGFVHEHMRKAIVDRIDPDRAIAWFRRMYGWGAADVRGQVLTPQGEADLLLAPGAAAADVDSIMAYQLPGEIMRDGRPVPGGSRLDAADHAYNASIYPKPARAKSAHGLAMADDGLGEFAAETGGLVA